MERNVVGISGRQRRLAGIGDRIIIIVGKRVDAFEPMEHTMGRRTSIQHRASDALLRGAQGVRARELRRKEGRTASSVAKVLTRGTT